MLTIRRSRLIYAIILIAMHNFFYLMPTSIGPIRYSDLLFLGLAFLIFYFYCQNRSLFSIGRFRNIILFIIVLVLTSSFAAWCNFGQGILEGILTQRAWLVTAFTYFVFCYFVYYEGFSFEDFLEIIYIVVGIELIVYFAQYALGEVHMFLNVNYNYRYGTIRLYCSITYMLIVLIAATEGLLQRKRIVINTCFIAGIMAYILLVNKGRGTAATFIVAMIVCVLLSKEKMRYKVVVCVLGALIGFRYLANSESVAEFVAVIFQGQEDGTYSVRLNSQSFYLEKWKSSIISILLGYGFGNSTNSASMQALGVNSGYLMADNGIYGFICGYGLVGIMWYIYYMISRLVNAIKVRQVSAIPIVMLVASLIQISTNVNYFYSYYSFEFVLTLTILELLSKEKNELTTENI